MSLLCPLVVPRLPLLPAYYPQSAAMSNNLVATRPQVNTTKLAVCVCVFALGSDGYPATSGDSFRGLTILT